MKKLLAVLMACAMMTGVFASCGKNESSESKKDVSVSDSSEEDKTTESETEEDTTESETEEETETTEETTTETTTESTTTADSETEEETTESVEEDTKTDFESIVNAVGVTDKNIVGTWFTDAGDETIMIFNLKEDGNADILMDMTELTHFTSDGKLFMNDTVFESDCIVYDGAGLAVTINEQDAFTMTKESGSADSFDGVYTMTSGTIYDSLMTSVDESTEIVVIISGEKLYSGYRNMFRYSADGETITMTGLETIGMEDDSQSKYEVNGDSIVFQDFDGEEMEMKKLVF